MRLAAHLLDRVVEAEALDRQRVDAGDQVARLDAGAPGRRVLDRRDDPDVAVVALGDFDAEADELALGAFAQLAVGFLVEVGRMRVERADHAGDGVGEQLLVVDRLDVVGFDQPVHVGQLAQFLDRHARFDRLLRQRRELHGNGHAGDQAEADEAGVLQC